jgi:RNA-binding protein
MSLTSKQRSYLRGLANNLDPVIQIGKGGITANLLIQVDEALEAREIVKGKVLKNYFGEVRETAQELAEKTGSEVIQVIGSIFVLYRASDENKISLPM